MTGQSCQAADSWLFSINLGEAAVNVEGKRLVSRDSGEQYPYGIRNGQTHLSQDVGGFLFNMPVNPGSNDIGTRHCLGSRWL